VLHVSIHAPARGATRDWWKPAGHPLVSIHAPARGATEGARPPPLCINVSIHAPARGATFLAGSSASSSSSFNPRARAGRDVLAQLDVAPVTVSIHAPARGATTAHQAVRAMALFQSTRPRGARRRASSLDARGTCFNPRARAGRDGTGREISPGSNSFNPRARAGRDAGPQRDQRLLQVSIHAPARGATSVRGWA